MNLEELRSIAVQGETEGVEFKRTTAQTKPAAQTVCGMLNNAGEGMVIFGVSDNGEIKGQEVTSKTLEKLASEFQKISPPALPEIETIALRFNLKAIVIKVSGMRRGPFTYDGRPYLRYGTTTSVMPHEEYARRLLEQAHAHQRWENAPAPEWVKLTDLDEEEVRLTLNNAIKLGRMILPKESDTKSILQGLGLLKGGQLLNAAVALYGKSTELVPQFPQLAIRQARFRGSDRLASFTDSRMYWGNAFNLLRRSESFLLDHMPIRGRVISGKMIREDFPLYPPRAYREAVANAICHRDYTAHGGTIAIAMYDDHLEVVNPGGFHFDITPEKLMVPHESKPWNPLIANVFYRIGIIEQWGTGTLSIIDGCEVNGNPQPNWEERTNSVITTFYPSTILTEAQGPESRPESRPESERVPLDRRVLRLLEKGTLSTAEIASKLGHKSISGGLRKVLRALLQQQSIGLTRPEKKGSRLQKYVINASRNSKGNIKE